jgi:glyoxylase-like metal-dependent hydrolase (beta-lactamase superfamily II)
LLTHAHFDHVTSLDALVAELPDVETAIGLREARLLEGDFELEPNE